MTINQAPPATSMRLPLDGSDPTPWDVVVVGAGLAGLAAAAVVARSGARVAVLDRHLPGGRARTTTVEPGIVFNAGPRALYAAGAGAPVLAELGIHPTGGTPDAAASTLLSEGVVHPMPTGPVSLLRSRLLSVRSKIAVGRLLAGIQRLDPSSLGHLSVEEWIDSNRLAPDAAALLRTIVRLTTYASDTAQLAADAAVSQTQLALGEGVIYLDGGWQVLVDALVGVATDAGAAVVTHVGAQSIGRSSPTGPWTVVADDRIMQATSVVLAPGQVDATRSLCPVPIDVSGLGAPVTAACWELAVNRPPDVSVLLGVDDPLYLSGHGPPARLGPDGVSVVHLLRYGARDSEIDRAALRDHARYAGIEDHHIVADRFLRRMVVSGGMPLPGRGFGGRPPVEVDDAPGVFLAGDWVGDVGLLGDAALASGWRAGQLAIERSASTAARRPVPS